MSWTLLLHILYFGRLLLIVDNEEELAKKQDVLITNYSGEEDLTAAMIVECLTLVAATFLTETCLDDTTPAQMSPSEFIRMWRHPKPEQE